MSEEKISIPIGLDASGVSNDIQKVSNSVGKATAGMARGISAAVGQSLGPFGELIEKADAFKQALSGISTGSKVMAGAVGLVGVAAVYSIKKAVEAYDEMRQAQDDAAESAKKLLQVQMEVSKSIEKNGIAAGEEGRATKTLVDSYVVAAGNGDKVEMARINKQLDRIRSGEATAQGEARLGESALGSGGKSARSEALFRNSLKGVSTADLPGLRAQLSNVQGIQENLATQPLTTEVGNSIKRNAEIEKSIERLIKALEQRSKEEEDRANAVLDTFFDGSFKSSSPPITTSEMKQVPTAYSIPSGYGVGGYTSTGGGGNIYGNTAGMGQRIATMAENVKKIAENTMPKNDEETFITQ